MTKFFTYSTALLAGLALLGSTQQADAQQFSKRKAAPLYDEDKQPTGTIG